MNIQFDDVEQNIVENCYKQDFKYLYKDDNKSFNQCSDFLDVNLLDRDDQQNIIIYQGDIVKKQQKQILYAFPFQQLQQNNVIPLSGFTFIIYCPKQVQTNTFKQWLKTLQDNQQQRILKYVIINKYSNSQKYDFYHIRIYGTLITFKQNIKSVVSSQLQQVNDFIAEYIIEFIENDLDKKYKYADHILNIFGKMPFIDNSTELDIHKYMQNTTNEYIFIILLQNLMMARQIQIFAVQNYIDISNNSYELFDYFMGYIVNKLSIQYMQQSVEKYDLYKEIKQNQQQNEFFIGPLLNHKIFNNFDSKQIEYIKQGTVLDMISEQKLDCVLLQNNRIIDVKNIKGQQFSDKITQLLLNNLQQPIIGYTRNQQHLSELNEHIQNNNCFYEFHFKTAEPEQIQKILTVQPINIELGEQQNLLMQMNQDNIDKYFIFFQSQFVSTDKYLGSITLYQCRQYLQTILRLLNFDLSQQCQIICKCSLSQSQKQHTHNYYVMKYDKNIGLNLKTEICQQFNISIDEPIVEEIFQMNSKISL